MATPKYMQIVNDLSPDALKRLEQTRKSTVKQVEISWFLTDSSLDAKTASPNSSRKGSVTDEGIIAGFIGLMRNKIGQTERDRLGKELLAVHSIKPMTVSNLEKAADHIRRKTDEDDFVGLIVNNHDAAQQVTYCRQRFADVHDPRGRPSLFRYGSSYAEVVTDNGSPFIDSLTLPQFQVAATKAIKFAKMVEGKVEAIFPPEDLTKHLYYSRDLPVPRLTALIGTPVFGADGNLIDETGYNLGGQVYLHLPSNLEIPTVPEVVTETEVGEARRWLVQELLGDFPFDGWKRADLEAAALGGDPTCPPPASLLNCVGFILEQFARPMIDGPLPACLFTKPSPRTGSTMLVNAIQMIVAGKASSQALADDEAERDKRSISMLKSGTSICLYDNVSGEIAGGVLAKLWTDRYYDGRELGASKHLSLPVACSFALTGNNPTFSRELAERVGRIRLDARAENPGLRTGFRHADILSWCGKNRGRLIWSALVLIRNWIQGGRREPVQPLWADPEKADPITWGGYSEYVRVIGGIIGAAATNWTTWQTNRQQMMTDSEEDAPIHALLAAWVEQGKSTPTLLEGMFCNDVSGRDGRVDPGLISLAVTHGIHIPVAKLDRADPFSFSPIPFGVWLSKYRDRVFKVDGVEIEMSRNVVRTKHGWSWRLTVVTTTTGENDNPVVIEPQAVALSVVRSSLTQGESPDLPAKTKPVASLGLAAFAKGPDIPNPWGQSRREQKAA